MTPAHVSARFVRVERQGRPIVLLHAGGLDSRMFARDVPSIARFAEVLRYDRSDSGKSPSAGAPVDRVRELRDVTATAFGDTPTLLVGCSFGGQLAIDYALAHPRLVAELLLIAPGVTGTAPRRRAAAPRPDAPASDPHRPARHLRKPRRRLDPRRHRRLGPLRRRGLPTAATGDEPRAVLTRPRARTGTTSARRADPTRCSQSGVMETACHAAARMERRSEERCCICLQAARSMLPVPLECVRS